MKLPQLSVFVAGVTLVGFALLAPAGTLPVAATSVGSGCPGNVDNCQTMFAQWDRDGYTIAVSHKRTNNIHTCQNCDNQLPWHWLDGTQIIWDYFDVQKNGQDYISDARPNGTICEQTTVTYGGECDPVVYE